MRIYEGDYAYEIESALDPVTRVGLGWRYNVYRVRPQEQLLRSGTAGTREEAEKSGESLIIKLQKEDEGSSREPRRSAA